MAKKSDVAGDDNIIKIRQASEHNLKSIDIDIPRNKLVVMTGLSGSGKSSLAFDTIYAEGQRRYVESLSTYARQFLGQMDKPSVGSIEGLTPTIAIEQRASNSTPRSTVSTATEIYDYLRLLFARVGIPHCHICNNPIAPQSNNYIVDKILKMPLLSRLQVFAPIVRSRKGEFKELFNSLAKDGFSRVRLNGEIFLLEDIPPIDKNLSHTVEILIDRIILKSDSRSRVADAVELSLKKTGGLCLVNSNYNDKEEEVLFNENFSCPDHGTVLNELSPRIFSFNNPYGACQICHGLGSTLELEPDLIISNPNLSLAEGAINAWKSCGSGFNLFYDNSAAKLALMFKISSSTPWKNIKSNLRKEILFGSNIYEGIIPNLRRRFQETASDTQKSRILEFMSNQSCLTCKGQRLKSESLAVTINKKNIANVTDLNITSSAEFFKNLKFSKEESLIANPILNAISERLQFLIDVGLNYLKLNRATNTLSGGEAQRIKLASQIGAKLAGVTYVLDEPTIGLHQHDNDQLLKTLYKLRDLGNSLIVVEHDEDIIQNSDYLIDIGPEAGENGGEVVAFGTPLEVKKTNSLTAQYLKGKLKIDPPKKPRSFNKNEFIYIIGCHSNNLKNISVKIPLGRFICVTGASGAGKSTLINDCLAGAIKNLLSNLPHTQNYYTSIKGVQKVDRLITIDQDPIGRTSRSNPATYTGFFDHIRSLFASMPDSLAKGYKASRFSFNVKGGRCEACQGQGSKTIEMHFLPNVHVKCEICDAKRYNAETLSIKFKNKNINDILNLTITEACVFFENQYQIIDKLRLLDEIGLGYIKLGQASTTLSGGESQRIKLCSELAKRDTGKTLYIMDEPTTGLHFHDISKLIKIIDKLVVKNNTVLVIEHNLDVIKCADWVIDLGPKGGDAGGEILAEGTPQEIANNPKSLTGLYLKSKI